MARIPIYRETQTPSGSFRVSELRVPDMNLDAMGSALQEVGQTLGRTAQVAIDIEQEEAKTWASNVSSDAERSFLERFESIKTDSNIATGDVPTVLLTEFDQYTKQTLEAAPQDSISRKMLKSNFRALRDSLWEKSINYQAVQGRAERISRMDNSILSTSQAVALDPNETRAMELYGRRMAEIDSLRITPSERAKLKESLRQTVGRSGAESMARNMPGVLLAQYENTKKMMAEGKKPTTSGNQFLDLLDSTEWDTYINMAQQEEDVVQVEGAAESVWNQLGPKSDLAPVNLDQMSKYVRENYGDRSPKEREAIMSILKDRASTFDYSVRQRVAASEASVWQQVLDGKTTDEIKNSLEFKSLNGEQKMRLLSEMGSDKESTQTVKQLALQLDLSSDPAKLAEMTNEQIIAMAPQIHTTGVKALLKQRAELNDPAKIQQAAIDEDMFKEIASRAGLKVYQKTKTDAEVERIGRFKTFVESRITQMQIEKKRTLSPDEKRAIAEQAASDTVMEGRFWGSDVSVPMGALTQEELLETYVEVNGEEINFSIVPPELAKKYREDLISQKLPSSDKDVLIHHLQIQQMKKIK